MKRKVLLIGLVVLLVWMLSGFVHMTPDVSAADQAGSVIGENSPTCSDPDSYVFGDKSSSSTLGYVCDPVRMYELVTWKFMGGFIVILTAISYVVIPANESE
jgi:hypothetical protein